MRRFKISPIMEDRIETLINSIEEEMHAVRVTARYEAQDYWISRMQIEGIKGGKDLQYFIDEMLENNVKSMAPQLRKYWRVYG
jgi:hypothetical protein